MEFLVAHGHDAGAVMNYSAEKLRLFYGLALARVVRTEAQNDLRQLRIIRCAVGSLMDKANLSHYKMTEEALVRAVNFDPNRPQNQKANLASVADRLMKMGAKRIYGRKH